MPPVGRSDRRAFCYLLVRSIHSLTREARQRLQAVEEFTELGSGFNLAMRDLDIRGAGNLLGAEQSGFIDDVGFETYHRILDEAVQGIRELQPDVVVLDYRFPPEDGGSGLDVLGAVKGDTAAAPVVIILTQYPYPAYREKCLELGADYFFDKASEFDQVTEVIEQLARG